MSNEKRIRIVKWIYFIVICLSPITFLFTLVLAWPVWILAIYFGIVILLYIVIHIFRSIAYVYTCPACKAKFKISFMKDITAYNAKTGAKVLVCPTCGVKDVMCSKIIQK